LLEAERRGDRGLGAGAAGEGAADHVGERGEAAVEPVLLEGPLGVLQAVHGRADARQHLVRLVSGVVALVEHLVAHVVPVIG
jgi:hypothetical protein